MAGVGLQVFQAVQLAADQFFPCGAMNKELTGLGGWTVERFVTQSPPIVGWLKTSACLSVDSLSFLYGGLVLAVPAGRACCADGV